MNPQTILFSLVALSVLMETSMGNQGNHCMVGASSSGMEKNLGNLVLTANAEECDKQYQALMLRAFDPILQSMGLNALKG